MPTRASKNLDAVFSQELSVQNVSEQCKLLAVSFGIAVTASHGTLVNKLLSCSL